jgi:uncharacterized protein YndB with AHSA1/START domain
MSSTASSQRRAVAKTEMLIRKPVSEVFAAFTEPEMITKFWLARASGRLEPGARVHWDFIVHGAASDVEVKELTPNERILISWADGDMVDFRFTRRGPRETFVKIENSGFKGDAGEVLDKAVDATGGFTLVLCELKALLEHGIRMNYGPDKFADARLNVERQPAG